MIYVVGYLVLVGLGLAFIRGASIASGNAEDPYRDVGNGGCTQEGSFRQYERDNDAFTARMSNVF